MAEDKCPKCGSELKWERLDFWLYPECTACDWRGDTGDCDAVANYLQSRLRRAEAERDAAVRETLQGVMEAYSTSVGETFCGWLIERIEQAGVDVSACEGEEETSGN